MIPRYSRKEMARIWEPENRFAIWLKIEILACEAWAELGKVPREAVEEIKAKAGFDIARIDAIEREVKHDVIAFLTAVAERVGPASRHIHLGLTSSDILDTALACQMREAADLLLEDVAGVERVLADLAVKHQGTVMIGRTHGIHAEPTTFGLKLAMWLMEVRRARERLVRAREVASYGKLSGAVGTFANVPPRVEEYVCERLGLKPEPISTQIIQRDRHAEYLAMLGIVGASLDKFATEIRHLQRTEVREVEEPFSEGQKGSSSMPHKRNPVACEQISGLSRLLRVQRPGRPGERGALARAGHQPLLRGADHSARQHHPPGLSPGPLPGDPGGDAGLSREHAAEPDRRPTASSSPSRSSWRWPRPAPRARRRTGWCSGTPCGPGKRARSSRRSSSTTPRCARSSARPKLKAASIWGIICATSRRSSVASG